MLGTQRKTINSGASADASIKVMIVDDSAVIRGLISRWIQEDPDMQVVATHRNGKLATDDIEKSDPDVVILDIEMPVMDGLTALPLILAKKRGLTVIMASTLTRRNAEVSMRALSLGATDYVAKPESSSQAASSLDFRRELLQKVRSLGARKLRRASLRASSLPQRRMRAETTGLRPSAAPQNSYRLNPRLALQKAKAQHGDENYSLRSMSPVLPKVLAIGSSTGGPQALHSVLENMGPRVKSLPILITQHMPRTFTTILAEHLGKSVGIPAKEGEHEEPLKAGHIYVAPGGYHMRVGAKDGRAVVLLDETAPINFCRPSVDPLFESIAEVFGSGVLALVLTGMGADGSKGSVFIADKGGSVIAQDEESSVVWGMPGAAVKAGSCSEILPLDKIGPRLASIIGGKVR
ncbi:protein-glutamate methylesterase/protein-glutamine glutaminase [Flexibacterium corallicola]|uniref:protein-glutamate methylesterase/protein-glutamine glutaminase n=1 Tax=Flexibacterium corallicola TaxID=3037259 RepID=UPI00286F650E|nr:chemotaxis response regulator protein-glutamate methylesterase [Pseudovibrio sp. M1P-2-3]